jgi:thymidine kinase
MAKLFFRYAVMNAGKSTQLLQIAHDYDKNGRSILCLKPKIDTKEGGFIISRLEDGLIKRKADFLTLPDKGWLYSKIKKTQTEAIKEGKPISVILIDEAQFLSELNVWDLTRIVAYLDIPVICFALKVDAFGKPFPGSAALFALSQDIEEVTTRAICCYSEKPRKATFQVRHINGKPVFSGSQVAIEDEHEILYKPVCLHEYIKMKDEADGWIDK